VAKHAISSLNSLFSQKRESLTLKELACLLAPFEPFPQNAHFGVAVSGGADSLALTLLMKQWADAHEYRFSAVTVNHHLRPESTQEATQVAEWLKALQINHEILDWTPPSDKKSIPQEVSRDARYGLLFDWCEKREVTYLLTAHHQEDVAETLIMRFVNGSGLDGLCGIAPLIKKPQTTLLRPLLTVSKESLKAFLIHQNQPWIEDASNQATRYKRARIRQFMETEGLSAHRLASVAEKLTQAHDYLTHQTNTWLEHNGAFHTAGFYLLSPQAFRQAHPEIRRRVLERTLKAVSGKAYPPSHASLEEVVCLLNVDCRGRTLQGCRITSWQGSILISRELNAIEEDRLLPAYQKTLWDNRFHIIVPQDGYHVGKLGTQNWAIVRREADPSLERAIPPLVKPTLPTLYKGSQIMAIPHLGIDFLKKGRDTHAFGTFLNI